MSMHSGGQPDENERARRVPLKLYVTLALSAFAAALFASFGGADRALAMAAMFVSTAADIVLMGLPGVKGRFRDPFAVGVILFAVAHVLYAAAFGRLLAAGALAWFNAGSVAGIILTAAVIAALTAAAAAGGLLKTPLYTGGALYLLIFGGDLATVFAYVYASGGSGLPAAPGIVLFLASDIVLALVKLGVIKPSGGARRLYMHPDVLIWVLYATGQALILIGA